MSLLGFDAIGRWALGQNPANKNAALIAGAGAVSSSGQAASFALSQAVAAGALALSGVTVTFQVTAPEAGSAFALSGATTAFKVSELALTGSFALNGVAATTAQVWPVAGTSYALTYRPAPLVPALVASPGAFQVAGVSANDTVLEAAAGAVVLVSPSPTALVRTGDDYDFKLGGVGHYLLEMEEAKRLAAITRDPPPPIDRRTAPIFGPLGRPQSVPPAPAVDMRAVQAQRMEAEKLAVQAAKKRRELEAILLLAS